MENSGLTVRDLRRQWKPHKERLGQIRSDHPTAIRFHRACSWLSEAERADGAAQLDLVLMQQWIAFNALYGQWDAQSREPVPDRTCWQVFLSRILDLDRVGYMVSVLQDHKPLVVSILEDAYLSRYFWQDPNIASAGRARSGRNRALSWYVEGLWGKIVEQLIERIYLLRCQLIHGAASCGSQLNRTAVQHCTTMMRWLLPAILQVWIAHGADEDWGIMCYPPLVAGAARNGAASSNGRGGLRW